MQTAPPPLPPPNPQINLQNPLRLQNLLHPIMLLLTHLLTRHDHHQIPLPTLLHLIVRHKLPRIPRPLPVLRHDPVPIHGDVHRLVHLVRHDPPDERVTWGGGVFGGGVDERGEARDGGWVGEFGVGHGGYVFGVLVEGWLGDGYFFFC